MPANFGIGTLETCRLLLEAAGPGGTDGSARPDFTFEHERRVGTGSRPAMAARRHDGGKNEMPASAPKESPTRAESRGCRRIFAAVNIAPGWGPAYSVARAPIHVVRSLKKLWNPAKKHGLALPCYGPRIRFMMVEKRRNHRSK